MAQLPYRIIGGWLPVPDSIPTAPRLSHCVTGNGTPVLFLPGLLTDGTLWSSVVQSFSRPFQSIACTLRNRVQHAARGGVDTISQLAALLNELGLASAHVVSHGAGWSLATSLAVRMPHRVQSVTVVDPVVPRMEQPRSVQEAWHLEMLLQWLSVAHGDVVRRPEHAAVLQAVVAQQTHVRMPEPGAPSMAGDMEPIMGCTPPPLASVHCPLLTLVGQEAPAESKRVIAAMFGQVRHARLLPVPGANRHSPVENPVAVARLIEAFLP
jgi:pimeloyl-ACP methyl ester carboxylesterase